MSNYVRRWRLIGFMREARQSFMALSELSESSHVAGEICEGFWKKGLSKVVLEGSEGH